MEHNEIKTRNVVSEFLREYKKKPTDENNVHWLNRQFARYPDLWESQAEREKDAENIVTNVERYEKSKTELQEHLAVGKSHESYFLSRIEAAATANGSVSIGQYACKRDTTLSEANRQMYDRVMTKNGTVDMNPQLKGNIMETDHTNTFNIDAAAKESAALAEVKVSYKRNSVDIGVKTESGANQRYQSKCCKTAERSEEAFQNGSYNGQRKLVAKGQTDGVKNSTDHLDADGVKSKARTNDEYEKMQDDVQQNGKVAEYEWNDVNKVAIAKSIGKKAALAGVLAVGFQGARILGRRAWNFITGQDNQSAEEDLKEFVVSSIQSGGGAGIAVATTGGITVAIKSGWLGKVLQGTPAGTIANAVCIGIENVKIMYKLGTGQISGKEALDQAGNATCSLAGGIMGGVKGAAIGAAMGAALGPIGAAIGGVAVGIVGSIAGSTVGQAVYAGAKAVVSTVEKVASAAWSGIKSFGRALNLLYWS